MFSMQRLPGALLALAAAVTLTACGTTTLSQVRDGQTGQPVWPAVAKAHPLLEATMRPDVAALRQIGTGTPKLEVYRLIGHPMYREGIAVVHEWDYVFHLPAPGTTTQEMTCQFKVLFDSQMLSRQIFWNPAGCANLMGPAAPPEPVKGPTVSNQQEISADFLFDFDSATLSADAPAVIDRQVMGVLDGTRRADSLRVIGFTDRLGSDRYNMDLSRRRAEAIKQYLVARGLPGDVIQTEGRGKAEPVVECGQTQRAALVACLKPNRRVRIEVLAR